MSTKPAGNRLAWLAPAFAAFLAAAPACAQSLPGLPAKDAAAPPAASPAASADDVRKALAAARKQLETIEQGGETPADAPPGTPLPEILQRLTLARTLASTYEKQLQAVQRAEAARERQAELQRASEAWRGFEQPPPHSVLVADELRDQREAARTERATANSTNELFTRLETEYASKLKASQGAARLAAEAADQARGSPAFPQRDWARGLATLRAAVDESIQQLLQMGLRGAQAEAAAAAAAAELAERKLGDLGRGTALPRADLERVLAEIEGRRRGAKRDLDAAVRAAARSSEAAAAEEVRLAGLRAASAQTATAEEAAARETAERQHAAAREVSETASQRVFLLREYLVQLDFEEATWEARAAALNLQDPVRSRAAYDRLTESLAGLRATRQYLEKQLATAGARLREEEARQRSPSHVDTPASRQLLEALRDRQSDLQRALDRAAPLQRLVAYFRADFEDRREASFLERARDALAGAWLAARSVWNYELFAIDDTYETADGRTLAVSRSVTVGKTFGAALFVVIGYWLASLVLKWIERRMVARGRLNAQSAALVRKWILFLVAAVLTLIGLFSASIPLTAFAFLGGALAIAAGFGLQTLLKNLVSGVMLLIERPLRLGDLIEVDGIRGRVTEIGIRASTIRGFEGIESLIPNSRFLEGNMTNWTYSNSQARQSVSIGVAYGSPLRDVAEILTNALARHGLVLKEPAPQVYLEAFGDSSVDFTLNYWVEFSEHGDPRRVRSDLLHMIDHAFAEAGIVIPFPQRDVRLAAAEPVPVKVVGSPEPRPAA